MLKLRTILLYNYPYYLLLLLVIIISVPRLMIKKESNYSENSIKFTGIITAYDNSKEYLKLTIKNKESVIAYYYYKHKKIKVNLGEKVQVIGKFNKPQKNTTKYLFNYQKYLYNKNIHYTISVTDIKILESKPNIFYKIKQFILNNTSSSPYLKAFILGNKSDISSEVLLSFQENGISHLFAISGMHITLLSSILLKILKKLRFKEEKRYLITSIVLIFYLSLIGLSPSALRGILFFILFSINKIYYFYIKPQNLFLVVLAITMLINPYFIYDVGFQYSFSISIMLIIMSRAITGNYLLKLFKSSFFSFLVSIPISLYNYFQINILSIIYNLFYVPFVSIIVFPLSLITIIIKPLLPIYNLLVLILEKTSLYLNKITIGKIIFPRLNIFVYIIYIIIIIVSFNYILRKDYKPLIVLSLIMFFHTNYSSITRNTYITMIDVGQGDSLLIHSNNESILFDTGGKLTLSDNSSSNIVKNTTIPLLKSLGIKKIKTLILTHGDADHMGEANYLVDNFKVENIIINSGTINYLEKALIKKRKDVMKGYEGLQISCGDFELIQLNKEYQDENTSSQIYYVTNGNINILLTGDATIESELNLISKYNLPKMDILKVGHHGSKTSSNKNFINVIKPKYSLISCGKDNKFNHPNEIVIENLKDSKIYRTDQDGSIMFKIKNDKIQIETCTP